tara:strand:+ start:194 stop:964 length:771 start_codon:yes stop_codon:yes gene_type:complete
MFEINKKIQIITKSPFYSFVIKDFLNHDLYKKLQTDIKEVENDLDYFKISNVKKYNVTSEMSEYNDFINKKASFKELHQIVFKSGFAKKFVNYFLLNCIKSNLDRPISILKLVKPKYFSQQNSISIKDIFLTKIKTNIQYSFMGNEGLIKPHVDSNRKLLSLMLYFPEYKNSDVLFEKEKQIGTSFWHSNFKNKKNLHLEYDQITKKFKMKKIFNNIFDQNNLYGFIKNNYSWHSVDKINIHEKYFRKSININFLY